MTTSPTADVMPTIEEILAGTTQAGVARPPSAFADDDDGTVQRVGSVPIPLAPPPAPASED